MTYARANDLRTMIRQLEAAHFDDPDDEHDRLNHIARLLGELRELLTGRKEPGHDA